MKKRSSLIKFMQLWGFLFLVILGMGIIFIDFITTIQDFNQQKKVVRKDYTTMQKDKIKHEVNQVVKTIYQERAQKDNLTRTEVRLRVDEAYSIAMNIYLQNKTSKTQAEIQKMIKDALRPIRFNNNNGYYFMTRLDGVEILFADRPEMENKNLISLQDTKGNYVIKDMIKIVKEQNEGFYEYFWTKPGAEGNNYKKISFIKHFEPYNWFIGTGLYVDDVEQQIKARLLEQIGRIRYGAEDYIFVVSYDGTTLMNDTQRHLIGKNIWNLTDPNGVKVIQEERKAVENPEGDFIYYTWEKPTTGKLSPKTSFMKGIKEWEWMIGTGIYLDDVETQIQDMQNKLSRELKTKIVFFILFLLGIITIFLLLSSWLKLRLNNDFKLFISFFDKAAFSNIAIDRNQVKFTELDQLAEYANKMLTDKKKAEEELLREREQLYVTIRSIGDGVITTDINGNVVLMNTVAEKLTGWTSGEASGKLISLVFNIIDSETRAQLTNPINTILESGQITGSVKNVVLLSKNGTEIQITDSGAPIKNSEGNIIGVVIVFREVTEEYKMQKVIQENEAIFNSFLENSPVYIFFKDKEIRSLKLSRNFEQMLGIPLEKALGKTMDELFPSDMAKHMMEDDKRILREGKTINVVEELGGRTYETTKFPIFIDGEPIMLAGFTLEITERKNAEEAHRKLQHQLLQSQKMESIGRLAGGVAHDLNNLLTPIIGYSEMLLEEMNINDFRRTDLKEIVSAGMKARDLVRQLLAFSRKQMLEFKPINLNNMLNQFEKLLRRTVREDIDFKLILTDSLPYIRGDAGQLEQVVMNLVVNAQDSMPEGGYLVIETSSVELDQQYCDIHEDIKAGKYVILSVADTGHGIDQEIISHIFEPFFTTKDIDKGTGLGLSTCYGIVKQHEGTITVFSERDKGTVFKVYLPITTEVIQQNDIPANQLENLRGSETILLVEDDSQVRDLAYAILRRQGYGVFFAEDGNIALEILTKQHGKIDLILTDVIMPGMSGKELYDKVAELYPGMKILYMSGYTNNIINNNKISDSDLNFIQKPFSVYHLAQKVRETLDT